MSYRVVVTDEASRDADVIFAWLRRRSPAGARRWYEAFLDSAASLTRNPEAYAPIPRTSQLGFVVRSKPFGTVHGNTYQLLFVVIDFDIRILRVRGPGQRSVRRRDLS